MSKAINKNVLITGCSGGLGLEMLKAFITANKKYNWNIIAVTRDAGKLNKINLGSDNIDVYQFDISNPDNIIDLYKNIKNKYNKLDCLINNAGYAYFTTVEDITLEKTREQFELNLFAAIEIIKRFIPLLSNASDGQYRDKIFNLSSVFGFSGSPISSIYCASKFALEGFSESIYYELKNYNIDICIVEPGAYKTNFMSNADQSSSQDALNNSTVNICHRKSFINFTDKIKNNKPLNNSRSLAKKIVSLAENNKILPIRVRLGKDCKFVYFIRRVLPEFVFYKLTSFINNKTFLNNKNITKQHEQQDKIFS